MGAMPLSAVGLMDRLSVEIADLELIPKEAEAERELEVLPSVETAGEGGQETALPITGTWSSNIALKCIMSPPRLMPPRSRRVTSASPAALVCGKREVQRDLRRWTMGWWKML